MYTMNRCLSLPRRLAARLTLGGLIGLVLLPAVAQDALQRTPPIPLAAERGVLVVTQPPDVLLDGQPARLSPGARIRGRNNLLLLSAPLIGQALTVRYVRDAQGLVHDVWVLTEAEALQRP
jgi:hypothetical protein